MDANMVPVKRQRVLVVDDVEDIRDTLAITLEREDNAVTGAATAEEALELVGATRYDLIILDVYLPGAMSGLDLLTILRERYSLLDMPIVMISGNNDTSLVVEALREGANDYLSKPLDLRAIRVRIKNLLTLKQLKDFNDHLLRTTSHDLKKPVMLMLDVVHQLKEMCPPGKVMTEDEHSSLSLLIESGEYMQQIINSLLDPRSLHLGMLPVTKKPTDFGAIVRQAVAHNIDYAKSKGIALKLKFYSEIPRIMADELRIKQVLDNLIGNAIKFSPSGSITTVSTRVEEQSIICDVSDNGPGIPEKDLDKLFLEHCNILNIPTGKEKSTGLGLAICKELISEHDGEIGAHNNSDGGATFWFQLPVNLDTSVR